MTTITIERAYEKGWIAAAKWAKRDDLVSDIDSAAYANERDTALAAPATAPDEIERLTECLKKANAQTATDAALERKPMGNPEAVAIIQKAGFKTWGSMMFRIIRLTEAFHGIKELAPAGSELPTNSADQAEVTLQGQIPAWHDAPTVPGVWLCDEGDENPYRFTCHDISMPLNPHLVGEGERWYGPIPEDKQ